MKFVKNTFDNCVLTNAILKNTDTSDDHAYKYLNNLRSMDLLIVAEYFTRSTNIINKIRELGVDNNQTWDKINESHGKSIITLIYQQNFSAVVPAIKKMILSLESQYEV